MRTVTGRKRLKRDARSKTLLELRLERLNRVSNSSLDILKRFHQRSSICERYIDGILQVEMCIRYAGPSTTDYFSAKIVERSAYTARSEPDLFPTTINGCQMPMLVTVGNIAQGFRPCASHVWLQQLDGVDVAIEESRQIRFGSRVKAALFVFGMGLNEFDGELGSILGPSGILNCEFVDEIIKSSAQVVNDLANNDRDIFGDIAVTERLILNGTSHVLSGLKSQIKRCNLILGEKFILARFSEPFDDQFQLTNVDVSPTDPFVGAV